MAAESVGAERVVFASSFVHTGREEVSVDQVRLPADQRLLVKEIRVVAGGCIVPGLSKSECFGLTAPRSFSLDVFVSDANQPECSVYKKIGSLDYVSEQKTCLTPDLLLPTNCLIFRGRYSALTVCVVALSAPSPQHKALVAAGVCSSASPVGRLLPPLVQPSATGAPIPTIGGGAPAIFDPRVPPPSPHALAVGTAFPHVTMMQSSLAAPSPIVVPPFDPTRPPPVLPSARPAAATIADASPPAGRASGAERADAERLLERPSSAGKSGERQSARRHDGKRKRQSSGGRDTKRRRVDSLERQLADEAQVRSPSDGDSGDAPDFENISEDEFDYEDASALEITEAEEDLLNKSVAPFSPSDFDPVALETFKFNRVEPSPRCDDYSSAKDALLEAVRSFADPFDERLSACCSAGAAATLLAFRGDWLTTVEGLLPSLGAALLACSPEEYSGAVETILRWQTCSLDQTAAMRQTPAPFIIRHLKMGIRLAAQLAQHDASLNARLTSVGVHKALCDLLEYSYMSLPLKLMILKALDALGSHFAGRAAFFGPDEPSVYARVTDSLLGKKSSRYQAAAKSLLVRLAVHETITHFDRNDISFSLSQSPDPNLLKTKTDVLLLCMTELLSVYKNAETMLVIKQHSLPLSVVAEIRVNADDRADPYSFLLQIFYDGCLLESLTTLCLCANLTASARFTGLFSKLVDHLSGHLHGLVYLCSKTSALRTLLDVCFAQSPDDVDEQSALRQVGVDLAPHVHALSAVDRLCVAQSARPPPAEDDAAVLVCLQELQLLTLSAPGRRALVRVLSCEATLAPLLGVLEQSGDADSDVKRRKSAAFGYAAEVLTHVVRCSESALLWQSVGGRLSTFGAQESSTRLGELRQFVEPLKKLPAEPHEAVAYLCGRVRHYVDEWSAARLPRGLATALRLLRHHIVEPFADESAGTPRQTKFSDATAVAFSADLFGTLLQLITKLTDWNMINWQQSMGFDNKDGMLFAGILSSALCIMRVFIESLVSARDSQFADLTPVKPLLLVFSMCCTLLPANAADSGLARLVRVQVLRCLRAYTRAETRRALGGGVASGSPDAGERRLWSSMVSLLLAFIEEAPCNAVGGLTALAELLPLPLPVRVDQPLADDKVHALALNRRLWASQLLALEADLRAVFKYAGTAQPPLHRSVRRLCLQLSDLSADMSTLVAKTLMAEVASAIPSTAVHESSLAPVESRLAMLINMLFHLTSQQRFKMTLLTLLNIHDSELDGLVAKIVKFLNVPSTSQCHVLYQENVMRLLLSLCDGADVSTLSRPSSSAEQASSKQLMAAEQMRTVCDGLLTHLGQPQQRYATLIPTLRVLLLCCESDYGLHFVRAALLAAGDQLRRFLGRLADEFEQHSSDCLSTLSTAVLFLRKLQQSGHSSPHGLCRADLKAALGWTRRAASSVKPHVFVAFAQLLQASADGALLATLAHVQKAAADDATLQSYSSTVDELLKTLEDESAEEEVERPPTPTQPPPPPLETQFAERAVWLLRGEATDMDSLLPNYDSFSTAVVDSVEEIEARVTCDLEAIRQEFLPQFDPKEELLRRVSNKHIDRINRKPGRPGIINTSRGEGKRTAAPLRGRGFVARSGAAPMRPPHDSFRSRPQNTSRAPSMHVDDFTVMESRVHADSAKARATERVRPALPSRVDAPAAGARSDAKPATHSNGRSDGAKQPPQERRRAAEQRRRPDAHSGRQQSSSARRPPTSSRKPERK